ncbi:uncharacterized protein LOC100115442 isoform X3 [Nasonia vitripennis]|uniref:Uncharacterized protein n=1 Tax=Nasonia vitripennis TaxID=7425 RepID=A0A7M7LR83_NASVI|nr:uncharacterized protein LOC100115442 isoform X3 [Nasonia vitripennis]
MRRGPHRCDRKVVESSNEDESRVPPEPSHPNSSFPQDCTGERRRPPEFPRAHPPDCSRVRRDKITVIGQVSSLPPGQSVPTVGAAAAVPRGNFVGRSLRRCSSSDNSKSSLIVLYRGGGAAAVADSSPDTRKSREDLTSDSVGSRVPQSSRALPATRPRVENRAASCTCCCVPKPRRRIVSKSAEFRYCRALEEEPCFDFALETSSLMAQRSGQQRSENLEPHLGLLMQHLQSKAAGDGQLNRIDSQRVFPFQDTPSGNLKIIPNQVVFESKKVSVLVAEPRHAKVNVKAERGDQASASRPREIDLPPGVTASTVDRLQAQHRLPAVPSECRPRTQPVNREKMLQQRDEAKQTVVQNGPVIRDVPLATLGFTSEQPIDWKNISLPEKTDLYQELSQRITTYKNADCIVRIGNDEFHCHLLVLQSYSAFFDDKNVKEIDLAGSSVTSRAFSIIYDWMISPTSESCHLLRRDNILEIFLAAQHLGIKELEEQCWAFIDNDELFSEDTAFLLYLEARKIGNTAVMELMVPRIMKFFLMLVSTKDFLELAVEELCLLLRSNYISVNSEMEVLMSAVRWLMHDWEGRKPYLLDVMKCVRFGLIAPWQLVDVKRNPENPEFMELMSYPEIQKMVDDGLAFVIIKYWYGNQTEDYYHWIDLLGLTEPTNRNWAGEDKNYVTYREFLLYLEEYQRTKISELKNKKSSQEKPSPPSSPPKEDSSSQQSTPPARARINHQNSKAGENSSSPSNSRPSKHSTTTDASGNNVPHAVPPCMMMPPEVLGQYLSSMGRNGAKPVTGDVRKCSKSGMNTCCAKRFSGGGEFPIKLIVRAACRPDTEKNSLPDVKSKLPKQRRDSVLKPGSKYLYSRQSLSSSLSNSPRKLPSTGRSGERSDSSKSEEEAATSIQAVYRGYKTRRKLKEITKESACYEQTANLHKFEPVKVALLYSDSRSEQGETLDKTPAFVEREDNHVSAEIQMSQLSRDENCRAIETIMPPPAYSPANEEKTSTDTATDPDEAAACLARNEDRSNAALERNNKKKTLHCSTGELRKKLRKLRKCAAKKARSSSLQFSGRIDRSDYGRRARGRVQSGAAGPGRLTVGNSSRCASSFSGLLSTGRIYLAGDRTNWTPRAGSDSHGRAEGAAC